MILCPKQKLLPNELPRPGSVASHYPFPSAGVTDGAQPDAARAHREARARVWGGG